MPDLVLSGTEVATYIGDEITLLEGHYLPEIFGEFSAWLTRYGSFMHES